MQFLKVQKKKKMGKKIKTRRKKWDVENKEKGKKDEDLQRKGGLGKWEKKKRR